MQHPAVLSYHPGTSWAAKEAQKQRDLEELARRELAQIEWLHHLKSDTR